MSTFVEDVESGPLRLKRMSICKLKRLKGASIDCIYIYIYSILMIFSSINNLNSSFQNTVSKDLILLKCEPTLETQL